jgi:hypothetical protein
MTDWRASVGTNGRYREEGVIPSGAAGEVEESMGSLPWVASGIRYLATGWAGGN